MLFLIFFSKYFQVYPLCSLNIMSLVYIYMNTPLLHRYHHPLEIVLGYVDSYLQDLLKNTTSCVKTQMIFWIKALPQPLPDGTFLVTIDVQSLYTNNEHEEGNIK